MHLPDFTLKMPLCKLGIFSQAFSEFSSSLSDLIRLSTIFLSRLLSDSRFLRIALGEYEAVSGGSVTFLLRTPTGTANWTGSGSFIISVVFVSTAGNEEVFLYTGGSNLAALGVNVNSTEAQVVGVLPRRNVSTATQTINFNQFIEPLNWACMDP